MIENNDRTIIGKILINGHEYDLWEGDTIGICLIRAGELIFRHSITGEPRRMFCGIGVCNDCVVTVDGIPNIRACVTKAKPGSKISTRDFVK